jgi:hypothetical protein
LFSRLVILSMIAMIVLLFLLGSADSATAVPIGNLVRLADDREWGDVVA